MWCCAMSFCRLLGGDDEQKESENEDEDDDESGDVDVCGINEDVQIDDMLSVMERLQNTSTTTTRTTSQSHVGATLDCSSTTTVCSTLMDSDVGKELDAALQNDIDGLLSSISDDQIGRSSDAITASSRSSADCLLTASVLSTEADQQFLFYPAQADELIDTFLRSTRDDTETDGEGSGELQAVELNAEDWPVDSLNDCLLYTSDAADE